MAATIRTTDHIDPITIISKDMTKHIRHLEKNVEKLKKLPKPDDILEGMKNELWYKMCTLCRSTMYGLSSDDFSAWKEGRNTSHPLEDKELLGELKEDNAVLGNIIKEKEKKIRDLEEKIKRNTKGEMQKKLENLLNEKERSGKEIEDLQKGKQTLQDQTDSLNKIKEELSSMLKTKEQDVNNLRGELDEKQESCDKIHEEKEQCMREVSRLQAERQTLQDQTDCLNRTVGDLSTMLNAKDQNIDKLTGELDETQEAYDKIHEEKEQCMREVSQQQAERQTLQDQTDSLNIAVEDMSSTLKTKDQNIDKLTRKLEETHNELDKIQKENENYVEQILKLQTENQTFQDQRDTPSKTNEEMVSNIDGQQQEMERFQNERDKIQKENDRHAIDISQKDQEEQTLQGQTYSLTKTIKEMASVIETQQKEVETLKKSFDETQTELEEVQMENEKNAKDKFQLQSERKSMMDKLFSIKYGMDEMSSTTEGLQQDIAAFLTELVKGDGKPSYEESRRFKRKVVVMRLLCTSRSGLGKIMVDMVTKELTRQLGGRQDLRKFEISIVLPNTSKGVSKGPLFVVCLNTMVLKHVPDALEGPKGGKDVYLLVLHQTTRENLSTLRPDSLRNTGSELRQFGGVIDMVFSSESGLFECNINNTAFEQITTVLKKY